MKQKYDALVKKKLWSLFLLILIIRPYHQNGYFGLKSKLMTLLKNKNPTLLLRDFDKKKV